MACTDPWAFPTRAALGPLPVGLAFGRLGRPAFTLQLLAIYPIACALAKIVFLRTPPGVSHPTHLE